MEKWGLFILLSTSIYFFSENLSLKKEISQLTAQIKRDAITLQHEQKSEEELRKQLILESEQLKNQKILVSKDITELSNQLNVKNQNLQSLLQKIRDLKRSLTDKEAVKQQQFQIQNNNDRIKNFDSKIKMTDQDLKALRIDKERAQQAIKIDGQAEVAKIQGRLREQEQFIKQTQNQINSWQHRKNDINMNSKVRELQSQLIQQKQDLLFLQQEQSETQKRIQSRLLGLQNQVAIETSNLLDSQQQVRQQMQGLQGEQKELDKAYQLSLKKTHDIEEQIRLLEIQYQMEFNVYQNLKNELQRRQRDFNQPPTS